MTVTIVQYARFRTKAGTYTGAPYQNFFINEAKTYNSVSYAYAPFVVAINPGTKGGDRSENVIAAPANAITLNLFAEAVQAGWLLEIHSVELNPETLEQVGLISSDLWRVARMESDEETVTLRLMSPLDAVRAQVPRRVLSAYLVGALPTSATIST